MVNESPNHRDVIETAVVTGFMPQENQRQRQKKCYEKKGRYNAFI